MKTDFGSAVLFHHTICDFAAEVEFCTDEQIRSDIMNWLYTPVEAQIEEAKL